MTPITTILFDVGGVLVRTEDRRPRMMLADAFGMTVQELEEIIFNSPSGQSAQRGDCTAAEHWEWVRDQLGLRPDELSAVRDTFFSGDVLDVELVRFLRDLKAHHRLGIITNALDDARQALTEKFQLVDLFEPIVVSAEEKVMKPDERIYRIALQRIGVQPGEAVFVDDFLENVRGAQAVGMAAVWFRNRDQAIADLKRILPDGSTS
ncbi:MAG TPA: HAD family phosphatase [Anaerolineales bacterium]|nr:HAD family phosphatase [Anaerolineales bacterium]